MNKFREIYNAELKNLKGSITSLQLNIFDHHDTRAFVYEICKKLVQAQQKDSADTGQRGVSYCKECGDPITIDYCNECSGR